MTTEKQILANQQNAKHSTGPRTESGKRRSRRNAIRHGLTAETVIDALEDAADYRAFERAIKSDYSPQTAIEGQLVSRLASLLWRLRRAVIIESGLLNIQAEMIQSPCLRPTNEYNVDRLSIFQKFLHSSELEKLLSRQQGGKDDIGIDSVGSETNQTNTNIARSFLRLTNLDSLVFERLGRYETTLWRQTAQILILLSEIEFRAKDRFLEERPDFGRVRKRHGRYLPLISIPLLVGGDRRIHTGMGAIACHHGCGICPRKAAQRAAFPLHLVRSRASSRNSRACP
jgi:hypothetical protein